MGGFTGIARNALPRVASFFGFWLILCGTKLADLVVGVLTEIAAKAAERPLYLCVTR
jgi:hypothetical protein